MSREGDELLLLVRSRGPELIAAIAAILAGAMSDPPDDPASS